MADPTSAEVLLIGREPGSAAPGPGRPRVAGNHLRLLVELVAQQGARGPGGGREAGDVGDVCDVGRVGHVEGRVHLLALPVDVDEGVPGEAEVSTKVVDALHPSLAGVLPQGALVDVCFTFRIVYQSRSATLESVLSTAMHKVI